MPPYQSLKTPGPQGGQAFRVTQPISVPIIQTRNMKIREAGCVLEATQQADGRTGSARLVKGQRGIGHSGLRQSGPESGGSSRLGYSSSRDGVPLDLNVFPSRGRVLSAPPQAPPRSFLGEVGAALSVGLPGSPAPPASQQACPALTGTWPEAAHSPLAVQHHPWGAWKLPVLGPTPQF